MAEENSFMEDVYVGYNMLRDQVMNIFQKRYLPSEGMYRAIYRMKKGIAPKDSWMLDEMGQLEKIL